MSPFYPFRGGGGLPKGDNVTFFYRFFYSAASLIGVTVRGVLIIDSTLFNGMECPAVVVITQEPGGGTGGRSSFLRTFASLIVVADSNRFNRDGIQIHFDVIQI